MFLLIRCFILLTFFVSVLGCNDEKEIFVSDEAQIIEIESALSEISPVFRSGSIYSVESAEKIQYSFAGHGFDKKYYGDYWIYNLKTDCVEHHFEPEDSLKRLLTEDLVLVLYTEKKLYPISFKTTELK